MQLKRLLKLKLFVECLALNESKCIVLCSLSLPSFLFRRDLIGTNGDRKTDKFQMSSTWTVRTGFNCHISLHFCFPYLIIFFFEVIVHITELFKGNQCLRFTKFIHFLFRFYLPGNEKKISFHQFCIHLRNDYDMFFIHNVFCHTSWKRELDNSPARTITLDNSHLG